MGLQTHLLCMLPCLSGMILVKQLGLLSTAHSIDLITISSCFIACPVQVAPDSKCSCLVLAASIVRFHKAGGTVLKKMVTFPLLLVSLKICILIKIQL